MAESHPHPSPKRFLIACGGTGGHLFPGISVAQELKRRGHDACLIISQKNIDQRALQAHPDLDSRQMAMIGMPRPFSLAMPGFLLKFWKAYRASRKMIRQLDAHAVLGMGGFTSMPPIMAARKLGKPTFIHESNAIPGKANRLTAKYCIAVFLGMPACETHFPKSTCYLTGTPVRDELREPIDRVTARSRFGLDPDKFTLLVMGGSQGARALNQAVREALPHLDPEAVQVLHLTGEEDEADMRSAYEKSGFTHHTAAFCDNMAAALASADAALCRSGASTMSELVQFRVPGILVPYPFAAEDHQTHNARPLEEAGAAVLCPQSDLTGVKLAQVLREQFFDPGKRSAMQRNLEPFRSENASMKISDIMEAYTT